MYTHARVPAQVRDTEPPYGEPTPAESFAAETVLHDLATTAEADVPLVVARFAALRAWELRRRGAAPEVQDHARRTALAYLDHVGRSKEEPELLAELVACDPGRALTVLESAAAAAAAADHGAGAAALRCAAHRIRWITAHRPPSTS